MKTNTVYEIEQFEVHAQCYRVIADSEAEAIQKLFDGEAQAVDGGLDYIEICEELGLPVDEYREFAHQLRSLGVAVDEHVIPSIRRLRRLESPPQPT